MIKVNDKYAIDSDKYQWIIKKKITPTEKYPNKEWEPIRYFTTPQAAVKGLGELLIRTSDYHSAEELKACAEAVAALLDVKFKELKVSYE